MKRCATCRIEKPTTDFCKNKWRNDGLYHQCRQCTSAIRKAARPRFTEEQKQRRRLSRNASYHRHKESINAQKKARRLNPEVRAALTARTRASYQHRKEEIKAKNRAWLKTAAGEAYVERRKASGRAREAWRKSGAKPESKAKSAAKYQKYRAERNWAGVLADWHRRKKYGLARGQFDAMMAERGNRCDICREAIESRACVDHDHVTGVVRGILCNRCNSAIGLMRESESIMSAAIAYLKRHREGAA